jgi:hypothetical protein
MADLTEIQKILPKFDSKDYLVLALLSEFCGLKAKKIAGSHLEELVVSHLQTWRPKRIILALKSITPEGISSLFPIQNGDTIPEPRKQLKEKAHKFVNKFQKHFRRKGWTPDDFDIRHWGVNHPFSRNVPRVKAIEEARQLQIDRRKNPSSLSAPIKVSPPLSTEIDDILASGALDPFFSNSLPPSFLTPSPHPLLDPLPIETIETNKYPLTPFAFPYTHSEIKSSENKTLSIPFSSSSFTSPKLPEPAATRQNVLFRDAILSANTSSFKKNALPTKKQQKRQPRQTHTADLTEIQKILPEFDSDDYLVLAVLSKFCAAKKNKSKGSNLDRLVAEHAQQWKPEKIILALESITPEGISSLFPKQNGYTIPEPRKKLKVKAFNFVNKFQKHFTSKKGWTPDDFDIRHWGVNHPFSSDTPRDQAIQKAIKLKVERERRKNPSSFHSTFITTATSTTATSTTATSTTATSTTPTSTTSSLINKNFIIKQPCENYSGFKTFATIFKDPTPEEYKIFCKISKPDLGKISAQNCVQLPENYHNWTLNKINKCIKSMDVEKIKTQANSWKDLSRPIIPGRKGDEKKWQLRRQKLADSVIEFLKHPKYEALVSKEIPSQKPITIPSKNLSHEFKIERSKPSVHIYNSTENSFPTPFTINETPFDSFNNISLPEFDLETNEHLAFPYTPPEIKSSENKTLSIPFSSLSFTSAKLPEPLPTKKQEKRKTISTQDNSVESSKKKKKCNQTHTADLTEIQKILPELDSDDYLVLASLSKFCTAIKKKSKGSNLDILTTRHPQQWKPERIILALKSITPEGISSLFPKQNGDTIPETRKQLKIKASVFLKKFEEYFINEGWTPDDFDIRYWGVNHPFSRDTPRKQAIKEAIQLKVERRKNPSSFHPTFFTATTTSSLVRTCDKTASSSQQQSTPHVEPRVFNPTSPRLGIRFWDQPKQPSTQIELQDSCLAPSVDPRITRGPR